MANLPAIRAAVCGKTLVTGKLVKWINGSEVCRCFLGELLHEAGIPDEDIIQRAENGPTYFECFPELATVYGLNEDTTREIWHTNDDYTRDLLPEQRASAVLEMVFRISCETSK